MLQILSQEKEVAVEEAPVAAVEVAMFLPNQAIQLSLKRSMKMESPWELPLK